MAILPGLGAAAGYAKVDLLKQGATAWKTVDAGWEFTNGVLTGASRIFDGTITDSAASTFLVSKTVFGGDIAVSMDLSFEQGRYLGVYLDFDQESQTGIWMATGHPLAEGAADNEVEHAYIKTVEESLWIVRATGELVVKPDISLHLRFERKGDYYSIYSNGTLIVTYCKPGGYPAGPLQIRVTNASVRIHSLLVESDWQR